METHKRGRNGSAGSTEQGPTTAGETSGRVHAKGAREDPKWLKNLRKEYGVEAALPCRRKYPKRLQHEDVSSRRKTCKSLLTQTLRNLVTICACCNQPGAGTWEPAGPAPSGTGVSGKRPAPERAPRKSRREAETRLLAQPEWQCEVEIAPLVEGAPPKRGTCAGDGEGGAGGRRNKRGVG